MEISTSLKETLRIKPFFFNNDDFTINCCKIFYAESFLLAKLLKYLKFRKDLKNIDVLIKEIELLITKKPKENIVNNNYSSIQIVIRAKSGVFKGFYILLPNFIDPK